MSLTGVRRLGWWGERGGGTVMRAICPVLLVSAVFIVCTAHCLHVFVVCTAQTSRRLATQNL